MNDFFSNENANDERPITGRCYPPIACRWRSDRFFPTFWARHLVNQCPRHAVLIVSGPCVSALISLSISAIFTGQQPTLCSSSRPPRSLRQVSRGQQQTKNKRKSMETASLTGVIFVRAQPEIFQRPSSAQVGADVHGQRFTSPGFISSETSLT